MNISRRTLLGSILLAPFVRPSPSKEMTLSEATVGHPTLIESWRGKLHLSSNESEPYNWFMGEEGGCVGFWDQPSGFWDQPTGRPLNIDYWTGKK